MSDLDRHHQRGTGFHQVPVRLRARTLQQRWALTKIQRWALTKTHHGNRLVLSQADDSLCGHVSEALSMADDKNGTCPLYVSMMGSDSPERTKVGRSSAWSKEQVAAVHDLFIQLSAVGRVSFSRFCHWWTPTIDKVKRHFLGTD
eukprot:SAG31_NODE_946_length_10832_cov_105.950806_8_plen_145_part_00